MNVFASLADDVVSNVAGLTKEVAGTFLGGI